MRSFTKTVTEKQLAANRQLAESRFESQKRAQAAEIRREKHEIRQEEKHSHWVMKAKLDLEIKQNSVKTAQAAKNSLKLPMLVLDNTRRAPALRAFPR